MKKILIISGAVVIIAVISLLVYKYSCSGTCENDNRKSEQNIAKLKSIKGLEMITVKGGEFLMGCTEEQANCDPNESPVHKVKVKTFKISKTEITVAQFAQFIKQSGYQTTAELNGGGYITATDPKQSSSGIWLNGSNGKEYLDALTSNFPVLNISYDDAVAFCEWAGGRLPTEAEWEFAARGGVESKNTRYPGSEDANDVAWFDNNSKGVVHPVAQKIPNELGLYDMGGNLWEWCADWYDKSYYSLSPEDNPTGLSTGKMRILRGGCWSYLDYKTRVSNRSYDVPQACLNIYGFRLAAD